MENKFWGLTSEESEERMKKIWGFDPQKNDCSQCYFNCGQEEGSSRIAGPCGQQNCWYDLF